MRVERVEIESVPAREADDAVLGRVAGHACEIDSGCLGAVTLASLVPGSTGRVVLEIFRVLEDAEGTVRALRGAPELRVIVADTFVFGALEVDAG